MPSWASIRDARVVVMGDIVKHLTDLPIQFIEHHYLILRV